MKIKITSHCLAQAKARSWLSSITKSGEGRATEAVAPPAEARTVATPESKPPPMSRAKSVRKAAAKLTGMSGAVWKSNIAAHLRPRLNRDLHAIDATPARRRGGVDSSARRSQHGRVIVEK